MISSSGPRVNNFLGRSAERRYHKAETNEEAADQYPTKARVKRVGKRSNLRLGQAVSWFPSGWVLMRVPAVANRGGSRCCCSPAPPGLSLLPQLYSDNVRA
jgi:hypothetical protein